METESGKTGIQKEEDLVRLKEWIEKQPHLPKNIDEEFLQAFVSGTKSLEIAKKKLDAFCTLRSKHPEYFTLPNRDATSEEFQSRCDIGELFVLPNPSPEGYRIVMFKVKDFSKYETFFYYLRNSMLMETVMSMWPDTSGLIFIYDSEGVDSSVFTKTKIAPILFAIQFLQQALPFKMKKAILYNAPSFLERFINSMVKPYIKKKLFDRVQISSQGIEVLSDIFPSELLPSDIAGGKAETCENLNDQWINIFKDRKDWFSKTSTFCSDEDKRPPDTANTYGVEGTFRTLSVD